MTMGIYDQMMREIAEESHVPVEEVRQSFSDALHCLETGARIRDFLPLLAMKHVRRDYLHKRHHPQVAGAAAKSSRHPLYKPVIHARQLPVPLL
jgi:hypothetical protein